MDIALFRFLNAFAGHGAVLNALIVFCASYLQYVLGLALVIAAIWPVKRYRMFIAAFTAAVIARYGVKTLIVHFVHRARPYVALQDVKNIIGPQTGEEYQSFPSGHVIFFFALATAVYRYDRRLGRWFFAGATLMGLARVAGGIHWPGDVIGGALLGMLIGWCTIQWVPAFRRPLTRIKEV
jgi:undecaprenyl-diphosphatase